MKRQNRSLVLALAATAVLASPGAARDREFSAAVHDIESAYHVHPSYRFLMWSMGMIVKVAHPEGVRSFRMALFEGRQFSGIGDDSEFALLLEKSLRQSSRQHPSEPWQPFVRVRSRRDNERTYIYARPRGNNLELFIVSLETDEAVVMKFRVNPHKLDDMMDEPRHIGKGRRDTSANLSPVEPAIARSE